MLKTLRATTFRLAGSIRSETRSIAWRRRQRNFVPHEIQRTPCGEPLRLWIADTDALDWYEASSYMEDRWPEMEFVRDRVTRPGDVVIDCGAHQGVTASLLSRWVGPTGRVIAIDPVRHNIDVARKNFALNRVVNVDLIHSAVSDQTGRVSIGSGTNVQIGVGLRLKEVEAIVLDSFVDARPTLIKLDIEGAEGMALAGAQMLLDLKPRIVMELHTPAQPKFGSSSAAILQTLWSRGYETWVLWDDHGVPEQLPKGTHVDRRVHVFAFPE